MFFLVSSSLKIFPPSGAARRARRRAAGSGAHLPLRFLVGVFFWGERRWKNQWSLQKYWENQWSLQNIGKARHIFMGHGLFSWSLQNFFGTSTEHICWDISLHCWDNEHEITPMISSRCIIPNNRTNGVEKWGNKGQKLTLVVGKKTNGELYWHALNFDDFWVNSMCPFNGFSEWIRLDIYIWLVVTGCHEFGIFPLILGCDHHPNWLSLIFFRTGWLKTTNQLIFSSR